MTDWESWTTCDSVPAVAEGEVHLWAIDREQEQVHLPRACAWLHAEEAGRMSQFKVRDAAADFCIGRASLRMLLSQLLDRAPEDVPIARDDNDKPMLDDSGGLQFNLSHSGGLILIGICRGGELGVDVERIDRSIDYEGIASRFFSSQEQAWLKAEGSGGSEFMRIWTMKEALLKSCGVGIRVNLNEVDVSQCVADGGGCVRFDDREWRLAALNPGEPYNAAFACEIRPPPLKNGNGA